MGIAVTGGTGFLGLHLVRELLARHRSLILLAHAGSVPALRRVAGFLTLVGAPREPLPERLRIVEVDLTRPHLGLSDGAYRQLADDIDVLWHCAGDTRLDLDVDIMRRLNVDGTRQVLDLLAAGRRRPRLHHVSTAFVAGSRREGTVPEDELDGSAGFENGYERSKHEAEALVRAWARDNGRPAVVFRPSVLVTDRPPHLDLPIHPLLLFARIFQTSISMLVEIGVRLSTEERVPFRLAGHADARLNFVPVEDAAAAMVRLASPCPRDGLATYHIVHEHDVPITTVLRLLERFVPELRIRLVPEPPEPPSELEAMRYLYPGHLPYLYHRRRFADAHTRAGLGGPVSARRIDLAYLLAGTLPPSFSAVG